MQKQTPPPANILRRGMAFLLDLILIDLFLLSPFDDVLASAVSSASLFDFLDSSLSTGIIVLAMLFSLYALCYFILCEYLVGATPGKLLFHLKVYAEQDLSLWQCLLRSLFLIPLFPFFILIIIDPLALLFSKTDQRISEYLSKSRVVEDIYG